MVQVVLVATSCVTVLLWRALYELFQGLLLLLDALLFNGLVPFLSARTFLVYHPINMHCHENCEKQAILFTYFYSSANVAVMAGSSDASAIK